MATLSSPPNQSCAHCDKEAKLICNGCIGAPDGTGSRVKKTLYCDPICQKADWGKHKTSCRDAKSRKILERTALTAQDLFYKFSRMVFKWNIGRVEKLGNLWMIHHHDTAGTRRNALVPFPTSIFSDSREQEAILSHLMCNSAVAHMGPIVKNMLKGSVPVYPPSRNDCISSSIDEITLSVKDRRIHIMQVHRTGLMDATDYQHKIFRITLPAGDVYALDLTGAQYGHHETLVPWTPYLDTRVRHIAEIRTFGSTKPWFEAAMEEKGPVTAAALQINKIFMATFARAVRDWEEMGVTLGGMLRLPEAGYGKKQRSLVGYVDGRLQQVKDELGGRGCFDVL